MVNLVPRDELVVDFGFLVLTSKMKVNDSKIYILNDWTPSSEIQFVEIGRSKNAPFLVLSYFSKLGRNDPDYLVSYWVIHQGAIKNSRLVEMVFLDDFTFHNVQSSLISFMTVTYLLLPLF